MIVMRAPRLAISLAVLLLVALPPALWGVARDLAFWPRLWTAQIVPFALAAEITVHLGLLVQQRQVRSAGPMVVVTGLLVVVRLLACAVWTPLAAQTAAEGGAALMTLWVGSPVLMALQIGVLVVVMPVALSILAPGFLAPRTLARMTEWDREAAKLAKTQVPTAPPKAPELESRAGQQSPQREHMAASAAPFLYSYSDLERYMKKVIGVEGFVILSAEGLPVWGCAPWQIGIEDLGGDLSRWLLASRPLVSPAAVVPQGAMVHSGDHWIVAQPLPGQATLNLFITSRHTGEQVVEIAARVTQTVASLFAHRYAEG